MTQCKQCKRQFHYCTSCGCDGYSEYDLCSDNCRLQYELRLSTAMTRDEALHIVHELCSDGFLVMTPKETAALRKVLLMPRYPAGLPAPPDAG